MKFITTFQIVPLILQCLKPHFKKAGEMVIINKYLYTKFCVEAPSDAPSSGPNSRRRHLNGLYITATKFIGDYLTLGRCYSRASAVEVQKLLDAAFPDLGEYMLGFGLDGQNVPRPRGASIDYLKFDRNIEVLGGTDWPAMYRIAELEEKRRGRTIR